MTSEQKGVDVLAVMDAVSSILRINATFDPQRQHEAARAAVADVLHLARIACELGRIPEGLSEAVNAARGQP